MTTLQASELNKTAFNTFTKSHEPVIINNNDEQMGIYFSMEDLEKFLTLQISVKNQINTGIIKGLEDVKKGRVTEYNKDFVKDFNQELDERLASK